MKSFEEFLVESADAGPIADLHTHHVAAAKGHRENYEAHRKMSESSANDAHTRQNSATQMGVHHRLATEHETAAGHLDSFLRSHLKIKKITKELK